jgi:hypothetical protein
MLDVLASLSLLFLNAGAANYCMNILIEFLGAEGFWCSAELIQYVLLLLNNL